MYYIDTLSLASVCVYASLCDVRATVSKYSCMLLKLIGIILPVVRKARDSVKSPKLEHVLLCIAWVVKLKCDQL